jgi:hypothetical protein
MAVQFDVLLMESDPFEYERAKSLLTSAGFIRGIHWDGSVIGDALFSIKLPTDGYVEVVLSTTTYGLAQFKEVSMIDRTGKEVPGITSDFNVVREVLAFIAGWDNNKIEKYSFWKFEGQMTFTDFAYLWFGAIDAMDRWVGLASTKFYPTPERINFTKEYFKEKIKIR